MQSNFMQFIDNFSSPSLAQKWLLNDIELAMLTDKEKLTYEITSFNE